MLQLRKWLIEHNYDALIIPGTDPHGSEYLPDHWNLRQYLSGFSGSSGSLVISTEKAALITDSRYEIQGAQEINPEIFDLIIDQREPGIPANIKWILDSFDKQPNIAIYEKQAFVSSHKVLDQLQNNSLIKVHVIDEHPLFQNWDDRPALNCSQWNAKGKELDDKNFNQKLSDIRSFMKEKNVDAHLISNLEAIARTLNIQAYDVPNNLLGISYLLVEEENCTVFAQRDAISTKLREHFGTYVGFEDYHALETTLPTLVEGKKVLIDPQELTLWVKRLLCNSSIVMGKSPCAEIIRKKSTRELDYFQEAHRIDGIALSKAFYELFQTVKTKKISEYDLGNRLEFYRSQHQKFIQNSFPAIVGYQSNGAIVHYRAPDKGSKEIGDEGCLLVDSGGHYQGGTTDITRTFSMSQSPEANLIRDYTLVLKGHLAITLSRFPKGTTGGQINILAKKFLWQEGKDFGHGTGHGVGYGTCVHETAGVGISPRNQLPLEAGQVLSNEPGYYKEGQYGIRIENLLAVVEDEAGWLRFHDLTLFPYDRKLIEIQLLSSDELKYINDYHQRVFHELSTDLNPEHTKWLKELCAPL